jgi:hypothetical protein
VTRSQIERLVEYLKGNSTASEKLSIKKKEVWSYLGSLKKKSNENIDFQVLYNKNGAILKSEGELKRTLSTGPVEWIF